MSRSWVIEEILSPSDPKPPMRAPDSWSTIAAGSNVTSGASTDRKITSRRMMMNRSESSWVFFPCLHGLLLVGDVGGEHTGQVDRQIARDVPRAAIACARLSVRVFDPVTSMIWTLEITSSSWAR